MSRDELIHRAAWKACFGSDADFPGMDRLYPPPPPEYYLFEQDRALRRFLDEPDYRSECTGVCT